MSILDHAQLRHEAGLRVTDVVPHPILPAETVEVYADTPPLTRLRDGDVERIGSDDAPPLPETLTDGRPLIAPCPSCGAHIARVESYYWQRDRDIFGGGIYSVTPRPVPLCFQLLPCRHVVSGWGYMPGDRPDA